MRYPPPAIPAELDDLAVCELLLPWFVGFIDQAEAAMEDPSLDTDAGIAALHRLAQVLKVTAEIPRSLEAEAPAGWSRPLVARMRKWVE